MTALCPGAGASQAKPGFPTVVHLTTAGLMATLNNVPTPYAVAFAVALTGIDITLTSMCVTDPPAQPTMSATDFADLLRPPGDLVQVAAVVKFTDWVRYFLWFQFCECVALNTPAPTIPAAPANLPVTNPPVGVLPTTPCSDITVDFLADASTVHSSHISMFPAVGAVNEVGIAFSTVVPTAVIPIPAPVNYHMEVSVGPAGAGHTVAVGLVWYSGSTVVRQDSLYSGLGGFGPFSSERVPPAGATSMYAWAQADAGATIPAVTLRARLTCAGQGAGSLPTPCCPPDPVLTAYLDYIKTYVTLIQRQVAPFAYVYGTDHPGLSGAGSITVSGLVGISVSPTTIPASKGREGSSPIEYFDLGFVTLGTADGFLTSRRVDHDGTLMLPGVTAGMYTRIAYDFAPGVVCDIRELVREP